jgi:hypothetical protein
MSLSLAVFLTLAGSKPKWVPNNLAGYAIGFGSETSQIRRKDRETGYWIGRGIDCDGAHVVVILTRDTKMFRNFSPLQPGDVQIAKLRNLGTDRGVTIGMTENQVSTKIGKPQQRKLDGPYVRTSYKWKNVKNGEGYIYSQELVFKKGKLIEISVGREAVPGC